MDCEMLLRSTIAMLCNCRVMGADAETFGGAISNLKKVVRAIEKSKEEANHDHHGEKREDV